MTKKQIFYIFYIYNDYFNSKKNKIHIILNFTKKIMFKVFNTDIFY